MKPGTFIRLPDGREATVVYKGLDGYGVQFGRVFVDLDEMLRYNTLFGEAPPDYPYHAEAMLRDPRLAKHWPGMECVGEEYEIIRDDEPTVATAERELVG